MEWLFGNNYKIDGFVFSQRCHEGGNAQFSWGVTIYYRIVTMSAVEDENEDEDEEKDKNENEEEDEIGRCMESPN